MIDYKKQIADERWKAKRKEIIQRDGFTCCACGSLGKTLNVHHLSYEKNKEYWDYPNSNFVTLCADCHKKLHNLKKGDLKMSIEQLKIIAEQRNNKKDIRPLNIEVRKGDEYPLVYINGFLSLSYSYAYYLSRTNRLLKGKIIIHYIKGFRAIVFGKRSKMTSLKNELNKLISFGIVDDFSYFKFHLKDIIKDENLCIYDKMLAEKRKTKDKLNI